MRAPARAARGDRGDDDRAAAARGRGAAAAAAARLLRPRGADPPAAGVAVDRRAPLRDRRRRSAAGSSTTQISNKLNSTKPIAVEPLPEPARSSSRAQNIKADGFAPVVNHHSSRTTAGGLVFKQDPIAGTAHAEGERRARSGSRPACRRSAVPDARRPAVDGRGRGADAAAPEARRARGHVDASPPARSPRRIRRRARSSPSGTTVRINVSKGPHAGRRAERRSASRSTRRPRRCRRPGFKVSPTLRRLRPAGEHGHQPEPGGRARPRGRAPSSR